MNHIKKESIPWETWVAYGDAKRGCGRDKKGNICKSCGGTGLNKSGDKKNPYCGCTKCKDNEEHYLVEE